LTQTNYRMPFPDGDDCVDGPGCGPDAVTVGSRSRRDEAEMGHFYCGACYVNTKLSFPETFAVPIRLP